jgi:hypothetical protein
MANSIPIPGPPGLPLLGNMADVDPLDSMRSLTRLADTYGLSTLIRTTLLQQDCKG